jgi:hypothetical protein
MIFIIGIALVMVLTYAIIVMEEKYNEGHR